MRQQFSLIEFSLCLIHPFLLSNISSVCVTILQALKLRPTLNPSDNGSEVSVLIVGRYSQGRPPHPAIEETVLPRLERRLAECLAVIHLNWTSTRGLGCRIQSREEMEGRVTFKSRAGSRWSPQDCLSSVGNLSVLNAESTAGLKALTLFLTSWVICD